MICRVIRTEGGETTTETFKSLLDAANYIDEMEEKIEGWWNETTPRNFKCDLVFEEGLSIQETLINDAGTWTDPPETFDGWDLDRHDYIAGPGSDSFMEDFQTFLIKCLEYENSAEGSDVFRIIQLFLDGKPIVAVSFSQSGSTSHRYKWNDSTLEYEGVS